jgi:hypothetical protein
VLGVLGGSVERQVRAHGDLGVRVLGDLKNEGGPVGLGHPVARLHTLVGLDGALEVVSRSLSRSLSWRVVCSANDTTTS